MASDDEQENQFDKSLQQLGEVLRAIRKELQFQAFRFLTGSTDKSHVLKQHGFIDGIHNPATNGGPVTITLLEGMVTVYQNTLEPGDSTPMLGIPFMRECAIITDGLPVVIWGRIRA